MPQDKTYLKCSAREKQFNDGGSILNVGFNAEWLITFIKANTNARGYFNLCISPRRSVGQYGDTHCVYLDTFQANSTGEKRTDNPLKDAPESKPTPPDDDVPF